MRTASERFMAVPCMVDADALTFSYGKNPAHWDSAIPQQMSLSGGSATARRLPKTMQSTLYFNYCNCLALTLIFQLAHTVEETTCPQPTAQGIIENEWAIHQMNTTVNFSRKNRLLSWYVGGLNFQVEHHLFPKICHVHYPQIAGIVESTAAEFNVPYLEHKTFGRAVRSHFATLRRFGKVPAMDELIG